VTPTLSLAVIVAISIVPIVAAQALPPVPEQALARLDASPRHGEWGGVEQGTAAATRYWLMFPERSDKAPVILVLHRLGELDDWTRAVTDQFAAAGYIAIAPELPPGSSARKARVESVLGYATALPAANGRAAVVVFDDGTLGETPDLSPAARPVLMVDVKADRGRAAQQEWRRVLEFLAERLR
jgi:carboxymethylenebutenolidase